MKTAMAKKGAIEQKWHLVDANGRTLGRLASRVAMILRGKNKPTFTPHVDTGDFVVIINADKVALTEKNGKKSCIFTTPVTPADLSLLARRG
jgi:large subunit ribosomal protein L13